MITKLQVTGLKSQVPGPATRILRSETHDAAAALVDAAPRAKPRDARSPTQGVLFGRAADATTVPHNTIRASPTEKNDGGARNPRAAALVENVGRPFHVLGTVQTPRFCTHHEQFGVVAVPRTRAHQRTRNPRRTPPTDTQPAPQTSTRTVAPPADDRRVHGDALRAPQAAAPTNRRCPKNRRAPTRMQPAFGT